MVKSNGTVVLCSYRCGSFLRVGHGGIYFQDSGNTVCTGHGFVQGNDQGSKFDQLHDHLCHVVVKGNDFTLLHVSQIDLYTCSLDQDYGCDIDQHIGGRI